MLPGTWAYVSAGAFGRAIIVSFQSVILAIIDVIIFFIVPCKHVFDMPIEMLWYVPFINGYFLN